ncbi:hypothetical protein [Flavobacterium sp. NKUCC04_CG]|uniref:hypothetical protein n=1 Tax=Flavobacterium sp. NKUCC04_CG TaxID=2842121 RepID=UPI001C5AD4BA|nr:hypothetical protein [Flavobacterium sp. NKUCC04_CG]MBW3518733.1 hypothetical protein [Flavobacterium sp. NKUCC04_CG]
MFKKISLVILLGLLYSCSKEEIPVQEQDLQLKNSIKTHDPAGYDSPYNGAAQMIQYTFYNHTDDLTLEYTANIGLAYFDGQDDLFYLGGLDMHTYLPSFISNTNTEYLTTVAADPIVLLPQNGTDYYGGHCPVIPIGWQASLFDISNNTTSGEPGIIYEWGKVYTIDFKITDSNNNVVIKSKIKVRFFDDTYDATNNPLWQNAGVYDLTGEQVLFNIESQELVIANSPTGTPSSVYFEFNNEKYYITSYTNAQQLIIEMNRVP